MNKVLWLDTETTGLNPKVHGLREVDGVEKEKCVFKINPFTYTSKKVEIDDYALSISGVTIEDLQGYERSSYCFKEFCNILTKYVNTDDKKDVFMIAGYNVSFDVGFIKDWFREVGLYDSYKDLFHYKNLDVFPLVITLKHLGLIDTVDDKLKTVCKHFNIQIDVHNALSDIQATKNLYELISDRFINDKEVFKQKEFDYRTKCQNIVSAARLEADDIAKGGYIDSKKSTDDINQMIEKLEDQSTFYKLVGYESDGRE
jgi:DNA polymerase III epsilon subunit-like protein